jgi:hypothetical protein
MILERTIRKSNNMKIPSRVSITQVAKYGGANHVNGDGSCLKLATLCISDIEITLYLG